MTNKIIIFLTILVYSTLNLSAQEVRVDSTSVNKISVDTNKSISISIDTNKFSCISVNSISISAGLYKPSMYYWNNTFLPNANTGDRFNSNLLISGNILVDLPLNLGARIGLWYWGEQVKGMSGGAFNSLDINFTGLSIGAFYKYTKVVFWDIKPYAGIDGSFLMIQDKYDDGGTVIKKSGYNCVFSPFFGIERTFINNIVLGIEYGYFLGSYVQDVQMFSGNENAKISIKGGRIQFTVGYKFPLAMQLLPLHKR